ncbi:TniQ family protein [Bradyrhizobium diversitatis]|uniref:TniQ family protein n=1 Tax=Bradyrhizobium diversitatis TaxID=2755406 RepID=A0ABS0NVG0_9BRAD|nr:TniQ family protein [Bradyrhizobium diversitatis]MBH5384986.1 TniQ family protein [Bradyrhizobium diversitatis]
MLRSDLFEVSPAPAPSGGRIGLPGHVVPVEGEALVSWAEGLSTVLSMTPRVLCRDAFGIDIGQDPEWWRRPAPLVLKRIESRTGLDRGRLVEMTLGDWALTSDDEEADRFAARRWTVCKVGKTLPGRIDVCALCLAQAPRPYIPLIWTLGWTAACPRHGVALSGRCQSCGKALRLRGLNGSEPIDLHCGRCAAPLTNVESLPAHSAVLDLQATLVAGKRNGTTILPGIGALNWPTTVALADVLLAMVWMRRTKKQRDYLVPRRRDRLFASIGRDFGMTRREWEGVSWTTNYGGLLLLAWLLSDLEVRLPRAIATLCAPRLEGLLTPFTGFDDAMKDHLRSILAMVGAKSPEGRRAWKPWLDSLIAADLREQSMRERYKHRRQRLRALAELKDGASVEIVATLVGVDTKSVYRWLHRGAAGGLEAALDRPTRKPALTSAQAEAMGQWIAGDRLRQNRQAVAERANVAFGIQLNLDVASKLLSKHGRAKRGRRRRLWGPMHGPRQRAGSTHDPAPGS